MGLVENIDSELQRLKQIESLIRGKEPSKEELIKDHDLVNKFSKIGYTLLGELYDHQKLQLEFAGQTSLTPPFLMMLYAWNQLASTFHKSEPPVPDSKNITPTFFNLDIGTFDAICVRDKNNKYAIGFDGEFIEGLFLSALIVGNELESWVEGGYVSENWDVFLEHPLPSAEILPALGALLDGVVHKGCALRSESVQDYLINNKQLTPKPFSTLLWNRICFFLVAHEFSHYLFDHHITKKAENNWRYNEYIAARELAVEEYPLYSFPDSKQARGFLHLQANEYQADNQAMEFLKTSGEYDINTDYGRRSFIVDMIAISTFFAYCDSIERLVLLRMRGRDPKLSPIFRRDAIVSDLCIRDEYPSPYLRWERLMYAIGIDVLGGAERVSLFTQPVWTLFTLPLKLEAVDRKVIAKSCSEHLVAKKWKSKASLQNLITKLWPDEEIKSVAEEHELECQDIAISQFWK